MIIPENAAYLTAVALLQVSVKGEWRYFWRLYGPQQDVAGRLLALAVGGGAGVLLPVLLGHVLRWKVLTGVVECIKATLFVFCFSSLSVGDTLLNHAWVLETVSVSFVLVLT